MFRKLLLGAALLGSLALPAQAGLITQSADIDYTDTDFSTVALSFQQFDTLGGTRQLDSIGFSLFGEVLSTARVENLSGSSGSNINVLINALLRLTSNTGQSLVTSLPSLSESFSATVFDGQLDFAGTSGKTFDSLYSSNTGTSLITDANILSLFIGDGIVSTLLDGTADTRAAGGGNIIAGFETDARGAITMNYNFSEVPTTNVSEPTHLALLGLGMMGLAASRRRRKGA